MTTKKVSKNLVLYIGKITQLILDKLEVYQKTTGKKIRVGLLYDSKEKITEESKELFKKLDVLIACDTKSELAIQKAILPYEHEILAVTTRDEASIPMLARIVPHFPYLKMPTAQSLLWASDKLAMRRRLRIYNPKISPAYTIVQDASKASLKKIEEKIGFPLILKPTGLAASRLVSICFHQEELEKDLRRAFRAMKRVYKENRYTREPTMLVEQFLDGEMYSIDGYVNSRGHVYFCPFVHVKTGRSIGFDDFFGYRQMTPTNLSKTSKDEGRNVAEQAVHALSLRSTTVHIELMKTENGWKIIELAARAGGFRHELYELTCGINHTANDFLIHIPQTPVIPKKIKGHAVAMKFFAKNEGHLIKLKGIKRAQTLESFVKITVNKKIGDKCTYAKKGGNSVFNIIMFNKDRSKLLADIRRLEQMIVIETKKSNSQ